jgi:hypothetical protein
VSELERRLLALGRELDLPRAPDLAAAVRRRLEERPGRPFPWRLAAAVTLAVLALAAGAALAVPQARTTILKWFHLRGVTVERVETLPGASEQSLAERLGRPLSRQAAERAVGFRLVLPPFRGGPPKRAYVLDNALATIFLRVPGKRTALLSEFRAASFVLLKKSIAGQTVIESVRVDGDEGLWLAGGPHVLTYVDRAGAFRQRPILIKGNVLLWIHEGLTLRLEGPLTKAQALRIARGVD